MKLGRVGRRFVRTVLTTCAVLAIPAAHAIVELDQGFNLGGTASISLVIGEERSHGIAIDANGRIILAGRVDITSNGTPPDYRLGLARLSSDGTPDNTFNGNGRLIFNNACGNGAALAPGGSAGKNVAVQPDGKIVLVASCTALVVPSYEFIMAARFNTDGTLDNTFDDDGIFHSPTSGPSLGLRANAVAVQANGRILVAGQSKPNNPPSIGFVIRLMPDGALDTSFGNNGAYSSAANSALVQVVRVMGDGRIVIGGSTLVLGATSHSNFLIERLTSAGLPDVTFNGTGSLSFNVGSLPAQTNQGELSQDYCFDIAVRPNGAVLCAGTTQPPNGFQVNNAVVAQFTSGGALDTSWGAGGFFSPTQSIPSATSDALAIGLRPGGDMLITGRAMQPMHVLANGGNTDNFYLPVEGWSVAVQSDQKFVVAVDQGSISADFMAKRFIAEIPLTPDTTPDPFIFPAVLGTPLSVQVESAPATITGLAAGADVTVTDGEFSIGCTGTWVSAGPTGTIMNGDTVCVRHLSAATSNVGTITVLTIGGIQGSFTTSTGDATPDAFTFADQTNVAKSTLITSAAVTISGINIAAPVSITGGEFSIGCGAAYASTAATVQNGQTVCVRHTSAAAANTSTTTTLTVGGISDGFTSTTAADPPASPPPPSIPVASGGGGGAIDQWMLALLAMLLSGALRRRLPQLITIS